MHYGEPTTRKAVPLALGLISVSNPQLNIMDALSKYSHDNDLAVALNAIFAMGLIGAGTNNARLAQMLRQLAGYYYKEPDCLFMVRIAQGLVHMGKGTLTLYPYFFDRTIMSRTAVAGLLATLIAFTEAKSCEWLRYISWPIPLTNSSQVVLDKYHWMLYYLVPAMYPRFMITLDEDLKNLPVTVRVGQVRYSVTLLLVSATIPKSIRAGCRGCRPSREATDDLRIPNSYVARAVGYDGTCGAGHGGVHSIRSRPRGLRYPEKEPWIRRQDGDLSFPVREVRVPPLSPPCNVFWAFCQVEVRKMIINHLALFLLSTLSCTLGELNPEEKQ